MPFVLFLLFVASLPGQTLELLTNSDPFIPSPPFTQLRPPNPPGPVPARTVRIVEFAGLNFDRQGRLLAATGSDFRIWRITPGGNAEVLAGDGRQLQPTPGPATATGLSNTHSVVEDSAGNIYFMTTGSGADGPPGLFVVRPNGQLERVEWYVETKGGLASDGGLGLFHDTGSRYQILFRNGSTTQLVVGPWNDGTIAWDGKPANGAPLASTPSMSYDPVRRELIWAFRNMIWMRDANGIARHIAGRDEFLPNYSGDGGPARQASIYPRAITRAPDGFIYLADLGCIRRIGPDGIINRVYGDCTKTGIEPMLQNGDDANTSRIYASSLAVDRTHIYFGTTRSLFRVPLPGSTSGPIVNTSGGIATASAFGASGVIAPGTWIEIFGNGLSRTTRQWADSDFRNGQGPTELDGVRVSIGGRPAFLSYVSPNQINAQVPDLPLGPSTLIVTNSTGSGTAVPVEIALRAPGLLAPPIFRVGGVQYAAAIHSDGAFVGRPDLIAGAAFRPARPGDVITLFAVGCGPTTPAIPPGQIATQTASLPQVNVTIGGAPARVLYAGLAPGTVGLYQFNVEIPQVAAGDRVIGITVEGVVARPAAVLTISN